MNSKRKSGLFERWKSCNFSNASLHNSTRDTACLMAILDGDYLSRELTSMVGCVHAGIARMIFHELDVDICQLPYDFGNHAFFRCSTGSRAYRVLLPDQISISY